MTAARRIEWDMAHRVPGHGGACRSLHGHRYVAEFEFGGELGPVGYALDFGEVKRVLGGWIDQHLDHTTCYQASDELLCAISKLNDAAEGTKPFFSMDLPPTAENIARMLHTVATDLLNVPIVRVRVWETPNCWAEAP